MRMKDITVDAVALTLFRKLQDFQTWDQSHPGYPPRIWRDSQWQFIDFTFKFADSANPDRPYQVLGNDGTYHTFTRDDFRLVLEDFCAAGIMKWHAMDDATRKRLMRYPKANSASLVHAAYYYTLGEGITCDASFLCRWQEWRKSHSGLLNPAGLLDGEE